MKMEQTECSETSAYKIQTPGNYPEESIQHSEHSESLNSRSELVVTVNTYGCCIGYTNGDIAYKIYVSETCS